MPLRRLALKAVTAMTPTHGRALVGLAVVALLPLAAYGCGEHGQSPGPPEYGSRPWRDPMAGQDAHNSVLTHLPEPCRPDREDEDYGPDLYEHLIHWSPDGSHLVFDVQTTIWTLDIERAKLLKLADVDPVQASTSGSMPTCPRTAPPYRLLRPASTPLRRLRVIRGEASDGTDKRRLTEDGYFDHYPMWSPDGERVAFVGQRKWADPTWAHPQLDIYTVTSSASQRRVKLSILPVKSGAGRIFDTLLRRGGVRQLEATSRLALAPPVWSPDGNHLAFIVNEGEGHQYSYRGRRAYRYTRVLHTVRADGSRLARIGETTALPTWSPDGDELAYATVDGDVPALYAVRPDGTGRRLIWSGGADEGFAPISQVLWSPDGSEILFFSNESYLVRPAGGDLRRLGIPRHVPDARAAWSPDGARIAIYFPNLQIVTVSRDGAELLVHAETGNIHAVPPRLGANPPEAIPPRGVFRALNPPLSIALDRLDCSAPATYVYASWLENCRPKGEDGS